MYIEFEPDFDFVTMANAAYKVVANINRYNGVPTFTWDKLTRRNKALYVMLAKQIYEFKIQEPKDYFELWKKTHLDDGWKLHRTLTIELKFNPFLKEWEELNKFERLQFQVYLFAIKEMVDIFVEG